jgi:hypothetical protein
MVEEFLAGHPGSHGPVEIGHALARSSGAIANALEHLVGTGSAERTSERPKRYRFVDADDPVADDLVADDPAAGAVDPDRSGTWGVDDRVADDAYKDGAVEGGQVELDVAENRVARGDHIVERGGKDTAAGGGGCGHGDTSTTDGFGTRHGLLNGPPREGGWGVETAG